MKIKETLKNIPIAYLLLKYPYRILFRPLALYNQIQHNRFRKKCYKEFYAGKKIINTSFGNQSVQYLAFSPKNYWHMKNGSQNEDKFAEVLFNKYVLENDVILDIGGHSGLYTIPFAKKVGENGTVYVCEPEDIGFNAIIKNIELNKIKNVTPIKIAVSDNNDNIRFYTRPDKDTHSIFMETTAPSPTGKQTEKVIKAMTVESIIKKYDLNSVGLVKVDVEGAELKVLDGINESANLIRAILVEIHEAFLKLDNIHDPHQAVQSKLNQIGFSNQTYLDEIHILATH